MPRILTRKTVVIFFLSLTSLLASPQPVQEPSNTPAEWTKTYEPFRIAGNLYYVGTYDLACYLIATPAGHILINTGLASSASVIKGNVESLGFKFTDIKILSTTQAHYDHMGAMATIKKETGASFFANEKDAAVIADGGSSDYALGGHGSTFEPVTIDRLMHDNDSISLGGTTLTMLHHPGHTKGSCSYLLTVQDDTRSYRVLIANMPSIVTEEDFSSIPAYPTIAADYKQTFKSLKKQSFDIWLASHASQFALHNKRKPGDNYHPAAFFDKKGYDSSVKELEGVYKEKIKSK